MIKRTIFTTTLIFFLVAFSSFASELTMTINPTGDGVAPKDPPNVTANETVEDTEVTVNWDPVLGVDGYNVYRIKSPDAAVFLATTTDTVYVDGGLEDGTYSYQVQSFVETLSSPLDDIPTPPVVIDTTEDVSSGGSSSGGSGGSSGGGGGSGSPGPVPLSAAAQAVDVNNDSKIDVLDFNSVMVNWGSSDTGNIADFNDDGVVDILDFNLLMVNWTG